MSKISAKWLPAVLVPSIVVVAAVAMPLQANAVVDLPDKTAAEVMLMVNTDENLAFSGVVEKISDMGLPAMQMSTGVTDSMKEQMTELAPKGMEDFVPGAADQGLITSALEALSGNHTARVFVGGSDKIRIQIQDRMSERNLVVNGNDVWGYDSMTSKVVHAVLPDATDAKAKAEVKAEEALAAFSAELAVDLSTPAKIADFFLSKIEPSTVVSVGEDVAVAGRSAYEIRLTPKATQTLVESVSVAVDSETGMPLQVVVRATGQESPAFKIGFTSIDFSQPDSALFNFQTPPGLTAEEIAVPSMTDLEELSKMSEISDIAELKALEGQFDKSAMPIVNGTGWDAIVEIPATAVPAELTDSPVFGQLANAVAGGKLFSTALINAFIADDGRIFIGSVSLEALQAAASK
jgi:outer membrane lipoprotein-sorting protein